MAYKDLEKKRKYEKVYHPKWRDKNRDWVNEYNRMRIAQNREAYNEYQKIWRKQNKEKCNRWIKRWRMENQEKCRKAKNRYNKRKYKDPQFRLTQTIRSHICRSLRGKKDGEHWETLVNFTLKDLIKHLEAQFDKNMNWDNYGPYWHVDHIIPISWFVFKKPEDIGFKMCWDLENLQPLEKIKNLKKGNKLN